MWFQVFFSIGGAVETFTFMRANSQYELDAAATYYAQKMVFTYLRSVQIPPPPNCY